MKWLIGIVIAAAAILGIFWVAQLGKDTANEASDVVTGSISQADRVTLESDVMSLKTSVLYSAIDAGELPTIALSGTTVTLTAGGMDSTVPVSDLVADAGLTGSTVDDVCVWVATADGTTVHITTLNSREEGPCP